MNIQNLLLSCLLVSTFTAATAAEDVVMKAEKAVVITFDSQTQRNYKLLGAENAAGQWTTLQDGIVGTGGEVTIFYKSESDQKLFFKVETSDGPAGQRSLLSLANLDISNKDLTRYDLEGQDLRGFTFNNSKFDEANLRAANLSEAAFTNATFLNADLSHAIAVQVNMYGANLNGADLQGIHFLGGNLAKADFRNANLSGVRFDGTYLKQANFAGQNLTNFSFRAAGSKWGIEDGLFGVNFTGANLAGADLSRNNANAIFSGANLTGVNFEGSVLDIAPAADVRSMFLRGVVFFWNWAGVNASGTDLTLALFHVSVSVSGANFEGSNMEGMTFLTDAGGSQTNVNFRNANLRGADLSNMTFTNCNFTGADLSFADVRSSRFQGCIGFNPEQPGMQFGEEVLGRRTILPDGTTRTSTNPGTQLAPATLPARLLFSIADGERNEQINFSFTGGGYSRNGGPQEGSVDQYFSRGRVATLILQRWFGGTNPSYKLLFTSPTSGQLYESVPKGGSFNLGGYYLVGTFTVPQQ